MAIVKLVTDNDICHANGSLAEGIEANCENNVNQ